MDVFLFIIVILVLKRWLNASASCKPWTKGNGVQSGVPPKACVGPRPPSGILFQEGSIWWIRTEIQAAAPGSGQVSGSVALVVGSKMVKVVPLPTWLSTLISPPWSLMKP